jgi:hypothetical protein
MSLSREIILARQRFDEAETNNRSELRPYREAHLAVQERVLSRVAEHHGLLVEQRSFDPLAMDRAASMWLLGGRCVALGGAIITLLRSDFTTEVMPTARSLQEACRGLYVLCDDNEADLLKSFLRSWMKPKDLSHAEKRREERLTKQIEAVGGTPPDSTSSLTTTLYRDLSRFSHVGRSGVVDAWQPRLRRYLDGPHGPAVLQAAWTRYGDHWIYEAAITVGFALMQLGSPACFVEVINELRPEMDAVEKEFPLDEDKLLEAIEAAQKVADVAEDEGGES